MATKAYVLVTVEPGRVGEVQERLRQTPGVVAADAVAGPYDLVAVVQVADAEAVGKLVMADLHGVPGLRGTLTLVVVG